MSALVPAARQALYAAMRSLGELSHVEADCVLRGFVAGMEYERTMAAEQKVESKTAAPDTKVIA